MKLIFIDEIELHDKNPNFFGIGIFMVDQFFYQPICCEFNKYFEHCGWDKEIEFKGRYLFSKKGDDCINIDKRIELVNNMANITVAKKNSRCRFTFFYNFKKKTKSNYLDLVKRGLSALSKITKSGGKNLVSIYYDETELVTIKELNKITKPTLLKRGLFQVELPCRIKSCNDTVGIIYADVLSYLKSWDVLHPEIEEEQQATLFELKVGQRNKDKLESIKRILLKVKSAKTKEV